MYNLMQYAEGWVDRVRAQRAACSVKGLSCTTKGVLIYSGNPQRADAGHRCT